MNQEENSSEDHEEQDLKHLALLDLDAGEIHPEEAFVIAALEAARKRVEAEALIQLLSDLPDQRIPSTSQQERYTREKRHRDNLRKKAEEAAAHAARIYILENPDARNLACVPNILVKQAKPRNKVDLKRYIEQVIGCILWQSDKFPTMSSILEHVNKEFPHAPQNANIWARELPLFQIKRIKVFIDGNRPDWGVSLARCKTLRDCRDAILRAKAKLSKRVTIKATLVVTPTKVLVNNSEFPITPVKSGEYQYQKVRVTTANGKRQWVRLDALLSLLGAEN